MENDVKSSRDVHEMLRAAAEQSWKNAATRSDLEKIGIKSEYELEDKLAKAIRDPSARSFDRAPNPEQGQIDRSTVVEAKIVGQDKREHTLTVVLNPERNEQGQINGGTVVVNDPNKPSLLSQELFKQYEKGKDPQILLRGADLNRSAEQSLKSPISRLDGRLDEFNTPTYEREKQVTPQQQQEADLGKQKTDIGPAVSTLGQQGRGTAYTLNREPTMIEKMQTRQKDQGQQQETQAQQQKRAVTLKPGLTL